MASGTATGTYTVTNTSPASGTARGTYDVTARSAARGTTTGTYDVLVPGAMRGVATGTYSVTALVPAAGLFRIVRGKIVRPYLYRVSGGKIIDQADGAFNGGAVTPPTPETLLGYVGDSLTVGGVTNGLVPLIAGLGFTITLTSNNQTQAVANGPNARLDGLVGRSITDGVSPYIPSSQDVINTWRGAGFHPNEWVVGLITNNFGQSLTTLKTTINKLLNLIVAEPSTKVLWVGPVLMPGSTLQSQIPTMKQALTEVAAARTDLTMVVLDMEAAIHNGRDETNLWLGGDGRHMTAAGYTLRNQIIVDRMVTEGMTHHAAFTPPPPGIVGANVTAKV